MATKNLLQVPPGRKSQQPPAVPTQEPRKPTLNELDQTATRARKQIAELKNQLLWLSLEMTRAQAEADSSRAPGLQPLEKGTTLTLTPEETQQVAEYLYKVDGLVSAVWDAESILRAVMEIATHAADELPGGAAARHGTVDVLQSYSPLHGAVCALELLIQRFVASYNRLEVAEWKLPATLREAKEEAEELFASDCGA